MKIRLSVCFALILLLLAGLAAADSPVKKGDEIIFGAYEQDGNGKNGKEPIRWIVVDVDSQTETMTVVSKYLLDCVQYNTSTRKTKWGETSLNKWLQNSFVQDAFSKTEQSVIVPINVSGEKQGVFILSEQEIKRYLKSYLCEPTKYAISRGCYKYNYQGKQRGSYWLRMDTSSKWGLFVGAKGRINKKKNQVTVRDNGVRPALHLSVNYEVDTEDADLSDMKTGDRITIDGIGRIEIMSFVKADTLKYFAAGDRQDTSLFYDAGKDTKYIFVKARITNTSGHTTDYTEKSSVEVVYCNKYRFRGWIQQYPSRNSEAVLSPEDRFAIKKEKTGYFCFGCTVPESITDSNQELKMIVNIAGEEITYVIHR